MSDINEPPSCELIFLCDHVTWQLRVRDLEAALALERSGLQEAQSGLELLRSQFREVERAYSLERERSSSTERALQRLQKEYNQCKSDLSVALDTERTMTSDLTARLEEEKKQHADTHTLLQQAAQRQSDAEDSVRHIKETLQQHTNTDMSPPAKDDGRRSPSAEVLQLLQTTLAAWRHRQEAADRQVQDLLRASERLQEEKQTLCQLTSDQSRQLQESQQASSTLEQEVRRLRQESSDWSTQSRALRAELEKEKEEREKEKEEREKEKEERVAEVQKITGHYETESKARLSFLYCVYQRLLAGCVLLDQPQCILGDFTWKELCDVINEQVDQLTSDLRGANAKITHLQSVCEKKSVCVRELQRSQECVLSRLEESVRRREEAWSSQHTHTVTQLQNELQLCRSQCDSLRDHVASLELHSSSLTSDLSRLRSLLSRSRRESACFLSACALLAGTLTHTHRRLQTLCRQKTLLCRRLAEREVLEEEVRRLARALGGEEDEEGEEEGRRRRRAVRRWRKSVCVVLAVRRWCALGKQTTVLFRLERGGRGGGGGPAVCVCGESTATQKSQDTLSTDKGADDGDEGRDGVCARWLRSKSLSSIILSSMADLQGALTHTGSAPLDVMSAARSALSRLLDHLLDQSEAASSVSTCRVDEDTLSGRLRLGLSRLTPLQRDMKALVSTLQQHFLLFSQRLHSAEVERRSLRLEVANLKRGLRHEREETVPAQQFHSVCAELRQALNREQEAQTLIQEQTNQLHTLQLRVNTHTAERTNTHHTLKQTAQSLSEARQEVSRKERSLRILGKHLSGVQRERKQLEERLQRAEGELRDAARRQDFLISNMKAAETSYKEVRESLVQSRRWLSAQPRPLLLPKDHLELSGAESIMGAPEVAACQSLLSTFSQLCHTCSSRIDWLEQEVSAHRSHVTALRSELQDACLRDNQALAPSVRCTVSACSCACFKPGTVQLRSCDRCGHSWVAHALAKLQFQTQPPSSCGPVEVALPGLVFDLSSLVLYGAQAVPVRLKILLDRLYSILTPDQVSHILHTLGWSLGDYVRGYMLQHPSGKVLDRWLMVAPEEELLILKQFLRFGETRPIVELMTLQCLTAVNHLSDPELSPAPKSCQSNINTFIERNGGTPEVFKNTSGDSRLVAGVCRFKKNSPVDHSEPVHHFENFPGGPSLLLPFHFPSPALHCLVPPTKELVPPSKLTQCLRKLSGTKLLERHRQEGGRREQENDRSLQQTEFEPGFKIKADPDKPHPPRSAWHQDRRFHRGRKGRVCCGVCGKSFYDKGTLKIHYNAVHLKIKHRCTVAGCTMVFSSLRSRNRHSANPNPRLHTGAGRDAHIQKNTHTDPHTSLHSDTLTYKARKDVHNTHTRMCKEKHISDTLWQHDDDDAHMRTHTVRNRLNVHTSSKHGCQDNTPPHSDSPPPSSHPLPQTLSQNTNQNFALNGSTYRSNLVPPPPPLLPAHSAPSLGSPPCLVSLVVPAVEKTERCRHLLSLTAPAPLTGPAPIPMASCDSCPVSCDCDVTEGKPEEAITSLLTSQQRRWESGDPMPKKKPRKSSMPVKIEREKVEGGRHEEEEEEEEEC
ncbi:hypothetical protein ABVT39_017153 [Epinephelus coioides]